MQIVFVDAIEIISNGSTVLFFREIETPPAAPARVFYQQLCFYD
jgi:hypothetical protein